MKIFFAYIIPGLGGLLFQIGYIVFTASIAMMAFLFAPIKRFFSKKREGKNKHKA